MNLIDAEPEQLVEQIEELAEERDELRRFLRDVTLHLQQPLSARKDTKMFNRAYKLYQKHDVDNIT